MKTERLAKFSAVAEILSSIAVVATLIFIVIEIRQNNSLIEQNSRAIRDAAIQSLDTGVLEIVTLFASTEENAVLLATGLRDYDQLSENQKTHFGSLLNGGYLRMDTSWWAYQNGLLPEGLWSRERSVLERWVNSDGGRIAWARANVSDEFRHYVDQTLAKGD